MSATRQRRMVARLHALQALFQMEASGQDAESVVGEFLAHRLGAVIDDVPLAEGDVDLFRSVVAEAVNWQAAIDQMTDRALKATWTIDRIDPTLRALFRAAGAELVTGLTPPKVVINEYVELAKAFFPEGREVRFVNGVLDHMARAAQPAAF